MLTGSRLVQDSRRKYSAKIKIIQCISGVGNVNNGMSSVCQSRRSLALAMVVVETTDYLP